MAVLSATEVPVEAPLFVQVRIWLARVDALVAWLALAGPALERRRVELERAVLHAELNGRLAHGDVQDSGQFFRRAVLDLEQPVLQAIVHRVEVVLRLELQRAGLQARIRGHAGGLEVNDPDLSGLVSQQAVGLDEAVTVGDGGFLVDHGPVLREPLADGLAAAVRHLESGVEPRDAGACVQFLPCHHLPGLVAAHAHLLAHVPQLLAAGNDGRLQRQGPVGGVIKDAGEREVDPTAAGQGLAVLECLDEPQPAGQVVRAGAGPDQPVVAGPDLGQPRKDAVGLEPTADIVIGAGGVRNAGGWWGHGDSWC